MGSILWAVVVVIGVVWLILVITGTLLGNLVHILLVVALAVLIYNLVTGRRSS